MLREWPRIVLRGVPCNRYTDYVIVSAEDRKGVRKNAPCGIWYISDLNSDVKGGAMDQHLTVVDWLSKS